MSEKRLIDANVVLAKQFTTGLSDASGNYYGHADVVFVDDIENAPTVDAVEVVRCRDCKHRYNGVHCTHPQLLSWSWGAIRKCENDDFCSYGERKDGDGAFAGSWRKSNLHRWGYCVRTVQSGAFVRIRDVG